MRFDTLLTPSEEKLTGAKRPGEPSIPLQCPASFPAQGSSGPGMLQRESNDKCRPFARCASRRDSASVALDNLSADCKPYPGAFVLTAAVQALERDEDPVKISFVKADAVILDRDLTNVVVSARAINPHNRRLFAVELKGIADEILQELEHLGPVGFDSGKLRALYAPACFLQRARQISQNLFDQYVQIHRDRRFKSYRHP